MKYIHRDRTYRFTDYLIIPFRAAPIPSCGKCLNMLLTALMTTAQAMATALFVDTALAIFAGNAVYHAMFYPAHLSSVDCGVRHCFKYGRPFYDARN